MNKTITMFKRIGAVILCLAMMFSVIMSSIVLPTVSAEPESEVKTFDVNFADLAALVDSTKYTDGLYQSSETDTAINEWINARFGVFVSREGSRYAEKAFLGQSSFNVVSFEAYNNGFNDNWGGDINLNISSDGALKQTTTKAGDGVVRKSHSLTVKNSYGDYAELSNFEAEVVFNKAGVNWFGGVFVSFHEETPGRMTTSSGKGNAGNDAVIVGGRSYAWDATYKVNMGTDDGIFLGNLATTSTKVPANFVSFGGMLDTTADYKLTVRVVGTNLTATVTKVADGSVVYTGSKTITASSGSLSVGFANSPRNIKTIKVTELDENGQPVDFGQKRTMQDFKWNFANSAWNSGNKYFTNRTTAAPYAHYYVFADQTTESAKAIMASVNKKFDNVYNREGTVKPSTFGKKVSYEGQTGQYAYFHNSYNNKWLQFTASGVSGREIMRHISSLVPKGHDGKQFYFQNFETTFTVRMDNVTGKSDATTVVGATIAFGFRQQTAGQFTTQWYGMNQNQVMVAFNTNGYNFAGGTDIIGARTSASNAADDMYNKMQNAFSSKLASNSVMTVTVRAVGDQVYLKIQDDGVTIVEETKTVPYVEPGYIAYGIGNFGSDIGSVTLTHLDENGNKISLYEQTQVEKDAFISLKATHREIDFKDVPGAEYVGGKYTAAGANYAAFGKFDPSVLDEVLTDVQMVFNDGATHITRGATTTDKGNWILFYNRWLQLEASPTKGETRMSNINALIPLDDNGIRQQLADTAVKFDFRIENSTKTIMVGLRQNAPGLFMTGENELNKNQVLVAITKNSIRVAGGDDIRFEDFALGYDMVDHDNDPETEEKKVWREYADDDFGDVFSEPLQVDGGVAISVEVRALGNKIEVTIRSDAGSQLYKGTFTTNYVASGYTAIATANGGGNIGAIRLSKLLSTGYFDSYPTTPVLSEQELEADGKDRLVADFLTQANKPVFYTDGVYVPTANDSSLNLWFTERFALRYNREDVATDRMYLGQPSTAFDANGVNTYWAFTESGTLLRKADANGESMLEQYDSLVPKAPNGLSATMQNFMAEYTVYDADAKEGAVVLSFRSTDRGVIAKGEQTIYTEQSMVIVGTDKNGDTGVSVVDGINADAAAYTIVQTKVPALNGVDSYKVTVKAVGTTVNVLITSLDGETIYYSNASQPNTIYNIGNGYMALGVTNTTKALGYFVLTELDENGAVVDLGTHTRDAGETFFFTVTDIIDMENATYLKEDGTTDTKNDVYKASRWNADGTPLLDGHEYVDLTDENGNPIRVEKKDEDGNVVMDGENPVMILPTGEQVGDPTKYAQFKGTNYYTFADKVGENAHPDASTIINYIDNKFAIYYSQEGRYYQMEAGLSKAYNSQTGNLGYFGTVYANRWLERNVSGANGAQTFRLVTSLVPRNAITGEELIFKNFETSFDIRFNDGINASSRDSNGVIIGFRQQVPGKFTDAYYAITKEQAFVAISPTGLTISAGDDIHNEYYVENGSHKPAEGDMYNQDQTAKFDSVLPQQVNVKVRVVGDKVTVTIKSGSTIYYDNSATPATINYDEEGYLAIGLSSGKVSIADINIARLDDIGEQTDIHGTESVPGCEWDTTADRFSETMNKTEADISALYDFYYHGETSYVAKEALTAHWAIVDGVLTRANDFGANNLATMTLKKDDTTLDTFKNFDAIFKVNFDDKKQNTFWLIGRQKDDQTIGQVVKSRTADSTEYYTDRFAIGISVGGKVTIATGDGKAAEISGRLAGTPTGTYNVRIRAYGRVVEVYLNGSLRATRNLPAEVADAGYLSFGFSGEEGGIASLYLTRLNDYGIAVDYTTEYTDVETFEPQMIGTNEGFEALTLPDTVKVWKAGVEEPEISEVFWDPKSVDFKAEGDAILIGYLKNTNGIRAAYPIHVGRYNRENTTMYNFDSAIELDDFESWYLPSTNGTDLPMIHTEGTADDNFIVKNGALTFQQNSMYASNAQMKEGVTLNGFTYKDERNWAGYASNHGVAVLKTQTFKNFILDIDVKGNGKWVPVGFGAKSYTDPLNIHATSKNGGFSIHIEDDSKNNKGSAKLWGYLEQNGTSEMFTSATVRPFSTGYHHFRIVVSDGVVQFFFDYAETAAITYELPETYEGGYIYLSMNDAGSEYDNLKIVDLDKEPIVITELLTEVSDMTINRALGEELTAMPTTVKVADAAGHEYTIAAPWGSEDYRSWKEGTFSFTLDSEKAWHGFDLTALQDKGITVTNIIGGDYDQTTSRKYYFDHENDLLDFTMQYSKHGYEYKDVYEADYHSMYSGVLVPNDKAFTVKNGKATNAASATGVGSGWTELQSMRGVATALLKDIHLYNFTLEFDFTHSGMWYTYGIVGVQDPTLAHKKADWSEHDFNDEDSEGNKLWQNNNIGRIFNAGGGVWIHNEQEGNLNLNGDMGGRTARYTKTNDGKVYDGTSDKKIYDRSQTHHMSITVVDGLVAVEMDRDPNNRMYYASLNETALGGFLGFGNHQNGSTIDNFQVTALDSTGYPIAWDDLVEGEHTGMAPQTIPDNYLGWKPKDDFVWGDEFED